MAIFSKIFKNKNDGDYAMALDIGTEVVKVLIFEIDFERRKGIVKGVGRVRQKPGDMQSGAVTDIAGVVSTCQEAIEKTQEMSGVEASQTVIGIAGELVKGITTIVHYERLNPEVKINMSELKNIIQKVQWKAFDKIRRQIAWETGQSEIDVKLINAAIVDVKIDGYRITNPLGFQGKDVSIGIFNAYAPLIHLGALQTIASDLGLNLLSIADEPYAMARSLGEERSLDFSAIFIDIGGGTTDIAVVRNGGVEGTKMFALGGRAFTKRISQDLGLSFGQAEEMKIKYAKNCLEEKISQKIEKILEEDCQVWLSGVELSLKEFSDADLLPSRILLCGGGSGLPDIEKVLKGTSWSEDLAFAKEPAITFIKPKEIESIIDKTEMLTEPADITPMALANLTLDLAGEENAISKILRKTIKMMQT